MVITQNILSYESACHYGLKRAENNDIRIRQVIHSAITAKTTKARKKGLHKLANIKELLRERTTLEWMQSNNKLNKIVLNADTLNQQGEGTQLETQEHRHCQNLFFQTNQVSLRAKSRTEDTLPRA
jgi:hypothetical protein